MNKSSARVLRPRRVWSGFARDRISGDAAVRCNTDSALYPTRLLAFFHRSQ